MVAGSGILRGMLVTLWYFLRSYVVKDVTVTVQYPEERLPEKERFRNFPFLVYDERPEAPRCVACDICAKECPPKCITIVMDKDEQGTPLKRPKSFDIDFTVCMNCGICEQVCPFDAIFMDHEFELATYTRFEELIYRKDRLLKPTSYFQQIRPTDAAQIDAKRQQKAAAKAARAAASPPPAGTASPPPPRGIPG